MELIHRDERNLSQLQIATSVEQTGLHTAIQNPQMTPVPVAEVDVLREACRFWLPVDPESTPPYIAFSL